jgi:hypothetical protein
MKMNDKSPMLSLDLSSIAENKWIKINDYQVAYTDSTGEINRSIPTQCDLVYESCLSDEHHQHYIDDIESRQKEFIKGIFPEGMHPICYDSQEFNVHIVTSQNLKQKKYAIGIKHYGCNINSVKPLTPSDRTILVMTPQALNKWFIWYEIEHYQIVHLKSLKIPDDTTTKEINTMQKLWSSSFHHLNGVAPFTSGYPQLYGVN